jgi:hypothetical protein
MQVLDHITFVPEALLSYLEFDFEGFSDLEGLAIRPMASLETVRLQMSWNGPTLTFTHA